LKSPDAKSSANAADTTAKKAKKKKRKVKLPKNYNPAIPLDLERWLPLRERSYYKGKRRKKNAIGKGTQGAVLTGKEPTSTAQSPKVGTISPEQTPKPKPPASASQQKKKKKPGPKW